MAADDVVDDLFMRVKAELIAFLTRDATGASRRWIF